MLFHQKQLITNNKKKKSLLVGLTDQVHTISTTFRRKNVQKMLHSLTFN